MQRSQQKPNSVLPFYAQVYFTKTIVGRAVDSFEPFKSPGLDEIVPAFIQKLKPNILPLLTNIFNNCIKFNVVPIQWQKARVVFIPKGGKSSHVKANDFRPISLTSFLLKIMERALDFVIKDKLPSGYLSNAQHAYQKGKSTETALHEAVHHIESSLHYKEFTLCCSLDIEGAFNKIETSCITLSLQQAKVQEPLIRWIESLLNQRTIVAEWGQTKTTRNVYRGTPQGGVLSPLLWILSLNTLLIAAPLRGIKIIAYADDVMLMVSGKFPDTLCDILQGCLNYTHKWASTCGLSLNPLKTKLILFTKKYKPPPLKDIKVQNTTIPLSREIKYLGVILDSKLNWKQNTIERTKKAYIAFYSCKRMFSRKWGLSPKITNWIYTSIVRPILLYGVVVWWTAFDNVSLCKQFERVQRLMCLSISGALKSTSTHSLNIILNILPIDLFAKGVAFKTALRLKESYGFRVRPFGHGNVSNIRSIKTDYQYPSTNITNNFTVEFPSRDYWASANTELTSGINIFTDGSKGEKGSGAGYYNANTNDRCSFKLPDNTSVFQAEIEALYQASIGLEGSSKLQITFFSDSQAALKALENPTIKSKTVQKCFNELQKLGSNNVVKLCWIPGHQGIEGNEVADELARRGAMSDSPALDLPLPIRYFYNLNYDKLINKSNNDWKSVNSSKIAKIFWPKHDPSKTDYLLSLSRKECGLVVGVTTGHCLTAHYLNKLGLLRDDSCRKCKDPNSKETVEHILCNCPALAKTRFKFLGKPFFHNLLEVH